MEAIADTGLLLETVATFAKIEGRLHRALKKDDLEVLFLAVNAVKSGRSAPAAERGDRAEFAGNTNGLVGVAPESADDFPAGVNAARLVADAAEMAASELVGSGVEMDGAILAARAADLAATRLVGADMEVVDPVFFTRNLVDELSAEVTPTAGVNAARLVADAAEMAASELVGSGVEMDGAILAARAADLAAARLAEGAGGTADLASFPGIIVEELAAELSKDAAAKNKPAKARSAKK